MIGPSPSMHFDMPHDLQVLSTLHPLPDLGASPQGPLVLHPCADLDEVAAHLRRQGFDALLLQLPDDTAAARLAHWPDLSHALLSSAMLLVQPEPQLADVQRWLQLGVQDVLPAREAVPERLALAVRQAVERKRLESAARRAYSTDLATGLPNHAQLMEHMTHLLALREREPAAMALLVLRIEGLATTERRLGAEAANVLRRKVAVRLRSGLRASDVVASIGSDSFAVLLAWIDDAAAGERVANKLVQLLQRPFSITGQDVAVAATAGTSLYPAHGKDANSLMQRAAGQAASQATVGRSGFANRAERGGTAAANDEG
jgi:diguanylate cyclase (GGDEF)-like protein